MDEREVDEGRNGVPLTPSHRDAVPDEAKMRASHKAFPDPPPRIGVTRDEHLPYADWLMEVLSPMHDLWKPDPSAWVFRGQANAEWDLKATAVRRPEAFAECGVPGDATGFVNRGGALNKMLDDFSERLDRAGMAIPVVTRSAIDRFGQSVEAGPVEERRLPLLALAQHHGLPTTLLDWTRRARHAAYFAAWFSLNDPPENLGTHIAIWCLRAPGFDDPRVAYVPKLRLRLAPLFGNPNMHAQAGLFTEVNDMNDRSVEQMVASFQTSIPKIDPAQVMPGTILEAPVLHRLTLPRVQAGKLLRRLAHEGVDGATMFPGADGVVRAMRERALWDKE